MNWVTLSNGSPRHRRRQPAFLLAAWLLLGACSSAPTNDTPDPAPQAPDATEPPLAAPERLTLDPTPAVPPRAADAAAELNEALVGQLLNLALSCVHQEYPNVLLHQLQTDADAQTPRQLHPAFYGCFDWHSSVHGHWLLARLARLFPDHPLAPEAREALFTSLDAANLTAELNYLTTPGRRSFERPYGLAWLLQLDQELAEWANDGEPLADRFRSNLEGLVDRAVENLALWLPKLTFPVRSGTHGQTAFALGLFWDWASYEQDGERQALIIREAERLYLGDERCPIHYEPSGHDFLSACLAEADLLRRVLPAAEFADWLARFLPGLGSAQPLAVAVVSDPTDGHLVHLDGLNLSRAWMLDGIESALAPEDPRRPVLHRLREEHRAVGLRSIIDPHYAGGHWLGSFATYLMTQRGLNSPDNAYP
ncbi:MAG: DUF2891 domain-containing protein [Pseudomonadota bacterium]